MATVLVTDGEERAALAVVRSLGRAGHRVDVCSTRSRSLAGASRYASDEHRVAHPCASPDGFAEDARRLAGRLGADVVLPVTEASLLAVLPRRERFAPARIPFPDISVVQRVSDKNAVLEAARSVGIDVPGQTRLGSPEALGELDPARLPFPLVLKPSRSVVFANGRGTKLNVRHVADARVLRATVRELPREAFPLLLQERVRGPGLGVFLLLWEGELVACFSHRRIREKPPSGGVSVYRESIPMSPELLDRSRRLLERIGWEGVAMVEYKLEEATGRPFLMEVNGRFWGSLQLAIDAGVDFPRLLVEATLGKDPTAVRDYRVGVRTRWLWGDVDHLLSRIRRSREALALGPEAPGRWRAIAEFLRAFGQRNRSEVFRWSDPAPALRETVEWIRGA